MPSIFGSTASRSELPCVSSQEPPPRTVPPSVCTVTFLNANVSGVQTISPRKLRYGTSATFPSLDATLARSHGFPLRSPSPPALARHLISSSLDAIGERKSAGLNLTDRSE